MFDKPEVVEDDQRSSSSSRRNTEILELASQHYRFSPSELIQTLFYSSPSGQHSPLLTNATAEEKLTIQHNDPKSGTPLFDQQHNPKKRKKPENPVGRRGSRLCTNCRSRRKGLKCEGIDPSKPDAPPCKPCFQRGPEHAATCDGPHLPLKQRQNVQHVPIAKSIPRNLNDKNTELEISAWLDAFERTLKFHNKRLENLENAVGPHIGESRNELTFTTFQADPLSQRVTRAQLGHGSPDFLTIFGTLSSSLEPLQAVRLSGDLQRDFQNRGTQVRDLRVDIRLEIPIIEWREGENIDVQMCFKITETADIWSPSSWLMHMSESSSGTSSRTRNRVIIRVSVQNFQHLRDLVDMLSRVQGKTVELTVDEVLDVRGENPTSREGLKTIANLLLDHTLSDYAAEPLARKDQLVYQLESRCLPEGPLLRRNHLTAEITYRNGAKCLVYQAIAEGITFG